MAQSEWPPRAMAQLTAADEAGIGTTIVGGQPPWGATPCTRVEGYFTKRRYETVRPCPLLTGMSRNARLLCAGL